MTALSQIKDVYNATRKRPVRIRRTPEQVALAWANRHLGGNENKLQASVVKHLKAFEEREGFRVVAIPNGGYRKPREADQLKNRGVRKGFPDLMVLAGTDIKRATPIIFIELKTAEGSLSDEQAEWHTWLGDMLFPVHVCTSLPSVLAVLRQHGLRV